MPVCPSVFTPRLFPLPSLPTPISFIHNSCPHLFVFLSLLFLFLPPCLPISTPFCACSCPLLSLFPPCSLPALITFPVRSYSSPPVPTLMSFCFHPFFSCSCPLLFLFPPLSVLVHALFSLCFHLVLSLLLSPSLLVLTLLSLFLPSCLSVSTPSFPVLAPFSSYFHPFLSLFPSSSLCLTPCSASNEFLLPFSFNPEA